MDCRLKRLKAMLALELDTHYSFPLLELVVSLFVIVTFYFAAGGPFSVFSEIPISSSWNGSAVVELFEEWVANHSSTTMVGMCYNLSFVLALFVPVLTALSFGRDTDTGILRTMLSYPVSRRQFFLAKESLILGMTCGAVSISYFLSLTTMEPGPSPMWFLALCIAATWIPSVLVSSLTALIAIATKSLPASLLGGLAVSFGLIVGPLMGQSMPLEVIATLDPSLAIAVYIMEDSAAHILQSLVVGLLAGLVLCVVTLLGCLVVVGKMEV